MNADEFGALRRAFHAAVELDAAARAAYLDELANGDAGLYAAVADLFVNLREGDLQAEPDAPPAQVGPFRLLQRIGRGGMGEVYLAERIGGDFEQRVALKLMRRGLPSSALRQRFLRERRILARLEHPHIARLLDGGLGAQGQPWLAMEYVAGIDIATHLRERNADLRTRVALVAQVVAAVAHVQRNLVVHRDIKPANILVSAAGVPKLLDFGIAKLLDEEGADQTRTAWRAMTTRYAAPEQLAGEVTTTATDVYALGVLLFELVCARSPYAVAEAAQSDWAAAILRAAPRSLAQACAVDYAAPERRRLRGGLEQIVQKALAKAPAQRYAGAAALGDDLEDWLADRPLRSGLGSARERTRQLLQRHRGALSLLLAVVLALGVGALAALRQARIAAAQAQVASAHLDTLLGVLGAASPQHYAGREPPTSEFLLRAADDLQRKHAGDPALLRRALSEIGNGLINLGRPAQAEPILRSAVAAAERDPAASPAARFGGYKLLALVQTDAAALRASAARVEALAAVPGADAHAAVDALGAVAGSLSRLGEFVAAERLFARGEALLAEVPPNESGALENFWRQRGWSALRAFELAAARESFTRAQAIVAAAPQRFSAMRRAEGESLLAETALLQRDAAAAQLHLAAARPVYRQEYPPEHMERAAFEFSEAQLALLQDDLASTRRHATAAAALAHAPDPRERSRWHWLQAELAVHSGDCTTAARARALAEVAQRELRPALPRELRWAEQLRARLDPICAALP